MAGAAFFDLDKTIIAKSSTLAFTKPLFRAGFLSRSSLFKAGVAQAYYQMFGAARRYFNSSRRPSKRSSRPWSMRRHWRSSTNTPGRVVGS